LRARDSRHIGESETLSRPFLDQSLFRHFPENELQLIAGDALAAGSGRVTQLRHQLEALEREIAQGEAPRLDDYAALRDEFELLGGY